MIDVIIAHLILIVVILLFLLVFLTYSIVYKRRGFNRKLSTQKRPRVEPFFPSRMEDKRLGYRQ